jgi:hypothetical protein
MKETYTFQNFGSREYIEAEDWKQALKEYKRRHAHDISQVKDWEYIEEIRRFIVKRSSNIRK